MALTSGQVIDIAKRASATQFVGDKERLITQLGSLSAEVDSSARRIALQRIAAASDEYEVSVRLSPNYVQD